MDRQAQRLELGLEQPLGLLEGPAVSTVVGEHHHGPGPGAAAPTGPALALEEGGHRDRPFVLEDGPHVRVVEANLQGACRDDEVSVGVRPGILRAAAGDAERLLQVVVQAPGELPELPLGVHLLQLDRRRRRRGRRLAVGWMEAQTGQAPGLLGVNHVGEPAVDDVEVIGEAEDLATIEVFRLKRRSLRGGEQVTRRQEPGEQHAALDRCGQEAPARGGVALHG